MTRALHLVVFAAAATLCVACPAKADRSEESADETTAEASPKKKKKKKEGAPSASASAVSAAAPSAGLPSAGVASAAPPDPLRRFEGDVPPGGTMRPIFRGGLPSGVAAVLPAAFEPGSGIYGDGYQSEILDRTNPNIPLKKCTMDLLVGEPGSAKGGAKNRYLDDLLPRLNFVKDIRWDAIENVKLGKDAVPSRVRHGAGVSIQNKAPWQIWCIDTVVKERFISGCGAWNSAYPELEDTVIAVLRSVREGVGVPTSQGQP